MLRQFLSTLMFLVPAVVLGQSPNPARPSGVAQSGQPTAMHLNVEVYPKSGLPVTGLTQSDFTVVDNTNPRPIASVRAVTRGQQPTEVILLFDAVNAPFQTLAFERGQVEKFLRASGGALPVPFTVAILTDQGTQILPGYSRDGNALATSIESNAPGLREMNRSAGVWGAEQRLDVSLKAAGQIFAYAAKQPGRKLVYWLSPGWPLLSGPGVQLDKRQQQQIFSNVVEFSNAMRGGDITLYSLNPLGPSESLFRADYYEAFLRGIGNPNQTDIADLSVQVLALQSGGLALNSSDVGSMIGKCLTDTGAWYELSFDPAPSEHANDYHHLEVKVDRPNLTVRTRDGYYGKP